MATEEGSPRPRRRERGQTRDIQYGGRFAPGQGAPQGVDLLQSLAELVELRFQSGLDGAERGLQAFGQAAQDTFNLLEAKTQRPQRHDLGARRSWSGP